MPSNSPFVIRQPPSGPTQGDMSPGFVLTVQADGRHVAPEPGGGGGAVLSVFTRINNVVAQLGDYAATLITNDSSVVGATVAAALNTLKAAIAAIPAAPVTSVFGRINAVVQVAGDYEASEVTNDSGVAGATVADALDTLAAAGGGVAPLALLESCSTGDWQGDGSAAWIKQQDGGPFIECTFPAWNAGDVLRATWWGNLKPTGTPGPGLAIFQIQVSLDAGVTWHNLAPAFSTAQFDDATDVSFFGIGASSSVATATAPLVRVAYQSNRIQVDYATNATGVFLRCERFAAGAYTPAGTLLP